MKKTKHFNISVPELGDVPDITQVSNAISDLEDATAGTLEIMKAEMQGTKITLTSVSRKTKRTGYYEGMSIRFKSPQDIEPNYLKTISVDGLGDQTLSVEYKVNRNEYIDIVYEGNKFTAYPVVVRKTDSVSNNSSVLVGTAKGVKTAYDKGVEALNKANQAQVTADKKEDRFNKKSGFNLDKTSALEDEENKLQTARGVLNGDLAVVGSNSLHSFPLSNATKGSIYYHKGTNRYYICIESHSGSSLTNPNTSFEELSVYTNRQRLDNLVTVTAPKIYQSGVWNDIPFPADAHSTIAIPIVCEYQDEFYFVIFDNSKTKFKTHSKIGDKGYVSISFVFLRVN